MYTFKDKATNNHTGFENILNIWSGPGPGGFGRTRSRCFHGPGRSLGSNGHFSKKYGKKIRVCGALLLPMQ